MNKKKVSLKNITPKSMSCILISYCPALYETEDNSYIIVGKLLRDKDMLAKLKNTISSDEVAIKVSKKLFSGLKP
jgi:hypothetical protein